MKKTKIKEDDGIPKLLPTPLLFAIAFVLLVIAVIGVLSFARLKSFYNF